MTEERFYIICLASLNPMVSWFSVNDSNCNFANCGTSENGGCVCLHKWAGKAASRPNKMLLVVVQKMLYWFCFMKLLANFQILAFGPKMMA